MTVFAQLLSEIIGTCRKAIDLVAPKLAMCNFLSDVSTFKRFALMKGFSGIDWTLKAEDLPENPIDESPLLKSITNLHPLEVRCYLAFNATHLGDVEIGNAKRAMQIFRSACQVIGSAARFGDCLIRV